MANFPLTFQESFSSDAFTLHMKDIQLGNVTIATTSVALSECYRNFVTEIFSSHEGAELLSNFLDRVSVNAETVEPKVDPSAILPTAINLVMPIAEDMGPNVHRDSMEESIELEESVLDLAEFEEEFENYDPNLSSESESSSPLTSTEPTPTSSTPKRARLSKTCDRCEYSCPESNNMNRHVKIVHDKVRGFACAVCPKKTATKFNLASHMKTHLKDKI